LSGRLAEGVGGSGRYRHRLVEQFSVLRSDDVLQRRLDEREVRIVRDDRLGKRGELHVLLAQLVNRPYNFLDGSFAAVEYRTELDRGGFHDSHRYLLAP
jgi:hypothetical protein